MKRAKALVLEIMERYAAAAEGACTVVGEYVAEATAEATEYIKYYGGYLLAGLAVVLAWLLLAVTMPAYKRLSLQDLRAGYGGSGGQDGGSL